MEHSLGYIQITIHATTSLNDLFCQRHVICLDNFIREKNTHTHRQDKIHHCNKNQGYLSLIYYINKRYHNIGNGHRHNRKHYQPNDLNKKKTKLQGMTFTSRTHSNIEF